jgi:hypothetical protein
VQVTIKGAGTPATFTFNGFLIYAERVTGGAKYGSWQTPAGTTISGQLPAACNGLGNTLTHSTTTAKGGADGYTLNWVVPASSIGTGQQVTFKALLLTSGSPRGLYTLQSAAITEQITAPSAATNIQVSGRWKCVVVSFTVDDGGSAINFIDVRSTADPAARANGTASPITICGLRNNVATTITITARNSINTGPTATSASVTPQCFCNGHSTTCNAATGYCDSCTGFTQGNYCETCVAGYTGDPTLEACQLIVPPGRGTASRLESSTVFMLSLALCAVIQLVRA